VCDSHYVADTFGNEDPQPQWSLHRKNTVTIDYNDNSKRAQARDLLETSCTSHDRDRCQYTSTAERSFTQDRSKWIPLTPQVDSCPPQTKETELTWGEKKTISWTDNFSGKSTTTFDIGLVKEAIELQYQHSVTEAREVSDTVKHYIPLNYRGQLWLVEGFHEVTGDFQIVNGDTIYVIKNAIFDFPAGATDMDGRGQPVHYAIVQPVFDLCSKAPKGQGAPPSPDGQLGPPDVLN
jgi:hypothetical protein